MKLLLMLLSFIMVAKPGSAQSPVGNWKKISHLSEFEGKKMDSHEALLSIRPCASDIIYRIDAEGNYRLDASKSNCDEKYKSIQEKLWSKTKWRIQGSKITLSATNFSVGQTYTITYSGNKMIWTGTEGQGVITYQRL